MWNPSTVAQNPTDSTQWKRLSTIDDAFDYSTDRAGASKKLHYRLDPPPYQEPVPPLGPSESELQTSLARVAPHFVRASAIFRALYEFATREYSDSNPHLGPLPPNTSDVATPLDAHEGHLILHPDYPSPNTPVKNKDGTQKQKNGVLFWHKNGRRAHSNHLHMQFDKTEFDAVRTE